MTTDTPAAYKHTHSIRIGATISKAFGLCAKLRSFADTLDATGSPTAPAHILSAHARSLATALQSLREGKADAQLTETISAARFACRAIVREINRRLPPYCYFGPHPDADTTFGFWLDRKALAHDMENGELAVVERPLTSKLFLIANNDGELILQQLCAEPHTLWIETPS